MLIGRRIDESQRQRDLLKKEIYRQMLDNQILNNQKYRHQQQLSQEKRVPNTQPHLPITHHSPLSSQYPTNTPRTVHLPPLKDKNTKCQGSSRYVAVNSQEKQQPRLRVRTQPPVQIASSQQEYFSRCQDIIKELQNINIRAPRHHRRQHRKPYVLENSRLIPRNNHSHSQSLHHTTQSEPRAIPSGRTHTEHNRVPSFIASINPGKLDQKESPPAKSTALAKFLNSNNVSQKAQVKETIPAKQQLTHVDSENEFVFQVPQALPEEKAVSSFVAEERVENQVPHRYGEKIVEGKEGIISETKKQNLSRVIPRSQSGTKSSINKPKSNLSDHDSHPQYTSGASVQLNFKNDEAENVRPAGMETPVAKSLQREAFLSVLRKLKNRGESLFQKVSKNKLEDGGQKRNDIQVDEY